MRATLISRQSSVDVSPNALILGLALLALNLTAMLGSKAALVFVLACGLYVIRNPGALLSEMRGAILLVALVIWCMLSTFWSYAPDATLRYSIQLAMTVAIGIMAASRLSSTSMLKTLLIAGFIISLACIVLGQPNHRGAWIGIFNSKNTQAQFASICVLASAATLRYWWHNPMWRAVSIVSVALGLLLLIMADSVGALLSTLLAVMAMGVLGQLHWLSKLQRIFIGTASVLIIIFCTLVIVGYFEEFSSAFLEMTGKDLTLTGRTVLWEIAFDEIAKYPFLGQGFKGYWIEGNPIPEALWAKFDIRAKAGFHFHNTFISNAVEIGLIGIALQAMIFIYALVSLLRWAILSPSAESIFLAGLFVRHFILIHSEVIFFSQFDMVSLLTVMAAIYAKRCNQEMRGTQSSSQRRQDFPQSTNTYLQPPLFQQASYR